MEVDNVMDEAEAPILKLDQDCCHAIFNYLTLKDQYSFAQTCQKFQHFFCCYIRYGHNHINFNEIDEIEAEEVLKLILNSGAKAKSIEAIGDTFKDIRNKFLYILAKYFPDLVQLKLYDFEVFYNKALKKLTGSLTNLRELSLVRCELNDVHCLYLQHCTKLEKLDLSENYLITAKYLDKFPNLIHLNLNYCRHVKPIYFIMLCKVSKLQHLHIAFCNWLNEISFRGMVKYLTEVDTLTISSTHRCKKLKLLTRMSKLKNLEIHGLHDVKPGFYQQLLDRKSSVLEKLTIIGSKRDIFLYDIEPIFNFSYLKYLNIKFLPCFNDNWLEKISEMDSLEYLGCVGCKNITSDVLVSVILRLQNLIEVDVSYCMQLGAFLVKELSDKLQSQNNRKKVTMHVGETNLMVFLNEDMYSKMYSDVLELTTNATAPIEHIRHALFRKPSYI